MKIGITGSQNFENDTLIKDLLFKLKNKFDIEKLIIATRANKLGVDRIVKQICKWEFGIKYTEFPTYFCDWNNDCKLNKTNPYKYGKDYNSKHIPIRDSLFIKYCDFLFLLLDKSENKQNEFLLNKVIKSKKKYITIYQ